MQDNEQHEDKPQQIQPAIRRATYTQLTIYEVEENELEILARGSPDSLLLNFVIFLLSIASSFLISLITAVLSDRVFIVFVIITTVGFMLGTLFFFIWFRNRKSVSSMIRTIRNRLPPEGEQEPK